jgi:fatty acid desaturase
MLNVNEARKLVLDLGKPREWLYLVDFLASYALAILSFIALYFGQNSPGVYLASSLVCVLSVYRAMSFTHEVVHFRQRLGVFRVVWNALAGVPLAFPSFMYSKSHAIHHNPKTYGTALDGEYIAFHLLSRWQIVGFLASSLWTPALLVLRFSVLFPLSLLSPALRTLLIERGSSVVITLNHKGEPPTGREKTEWLVMETACCVFWWAVFTASWVTQFDPQFFVLAYSVVVGALFLNGLRTLAAHRFSNDGKVMTVEEQLLDSVNLVNGPPGSLLSALAAPVGLRFHALHHLFPFLPYHSLGEAHRRLSRALPASSSYHATSEKGVLTALGKLWSREVVPLSAARSQ